jgi:RNA polymerase sigma-70 factor (ECF subfamily)
LADSKDEFESAVMIHLNAAYNLARWLVKDDSGAEDVVQEACLRAFRYYDRFRGGDARPWLLGIVRNAAFDWLRARGVVHTVARDEDESIAEEVAPMQDSPEALLLRKREAAEIDAAIGLLPENFREVIVLRAIEEMTYEDIAAVTGVPVGTVMSRLSRARSLLRKTLSRVDGEMK